MIRNVTLDEISDGRLYGLNDLVKADCYDCKGCSACCRGMGDSIVLTPYDVYLLSVNMGVSVEELIKEEKIELAIHDGVILPNLSMSGEGEACGFLNGEGRCTIHSFRPGICRLFPLGRYYEEEGFRYFLQIHECKNKARGKVKVLKWIDTPEIEKNEAFIFRWHELVKNVSEFMQESEDEEMKRRVNLRLLQIFFMTPYTKEDFYEQIDRRFHMLEN